MSTFLAALGLGLIFNAVPGAIFAETVRHGVRGGFKPALAVQIGSLVGDALWAVLGLLGVGLLLQIEALRFPVGIVGALYLSWLARDSWRAANREFVISGRGAKPKLGDAARSGAALSIANPQNIAYWAALGSGLGAVGVHNPAASDYAVFFGGFMTSSIFWCFFCAAVVDRVFLNVGARWARVTYRACAVAFLALALASVRELTRQETPSPVVPPGLHRSP